MQATLDLIIKNWRKIAFVIILFFIAMFTGKIIVSRFNYFLLLLLFLGAIVLLVLKEFEIFILLLFVVNHEFFSLLRFEGLGGYDYQGLLYVMLFATLPLYVIKKEHKSDVNFNLFIISFLIIVSIGVINAHLQGQSIILGIKAAKSYFLILLYFVFMTRIMDVKKLFRFIVISGVLLSLANNIQYLFFGRISVFYELVSWVRIGQVRFLVGGFFIIFASLIAFGEFLRSKSTWNLVAFIYMACTVIFQGQTRAIIMGFMISTLGLLYLAKYINFKTIVIVGIPALVVLIWISPLIQARFFSELYQITRLEIEERRGSAGLRFGSYEYFLSEIKQSPVIGRGIWNEAYVGNNPEYMSREDFHLSDIGIMGFIFHTGLLGLIWLFLLLRKVYKLEFFRRGQPRENYHYGIVGYFIFGLTILLTINAFTHGATIIYFAFALALISQLCSSSQAFSKAEINESLNSHSKL